MAARLKKDEKKGFSVQDFLDSDKAKREEETPGSSGGNDNNAPLNPQPSTPVNESAPAVAKADDVD